MSNSLDLIATSAFGLEAVVARELKGLGYESKVIQPGRLLFKASPPAICRTNVHLRVAERVLVCVAQIPASNFDDLFDGVGGLPWEDWIPRDGQFPVGGRSRKSQLTSVPALQRATKRAIADRLASYYGSSLPETGPLYPIEVALLDDVATLTIDTTGDGLHKRGYRPLTGPAPLRETMAAALVQLSFWKADRPFLDPFCGSGTIPIEAAMIGRNIAPGLRRQFTAESWSQITPETWASVRASAESMILPALTEKLVATDADPNVLSTARYHAERAGVASDIHWQQRDFGDLTSKREYGCLICNPPYGRRLEEQPSIDELLASFPMVLRRLPTWSHFILSSNSEFESIIGQRANRRRKLYNGRIECQYYQFHGPKRVPDGHPRRARPYTTSATPATEDLNAMSEPPPQTPTAQHLVKQHLVAPSPAVQAPTSDLERPTGVSKPPPAAPSNARPFTEVPAFGGLDSEAQRQANEFSNRLKKRARHLRRWPKRGTTCFRLYERDIPEIPLIVDRYDEYLHIAEFDRPHDRTPAQHADWLDLMIKTAAAALEVSPKNVYFKRRSRQRDRMQYQKVDSSEAIVTVQESGLAFRVNLSDYLDTGLFLDHRNTRRMVRETANGTRFLNLFGYTGTFTVYAAAAGARETVTVDASATYLDWARENLRLNGLFGAQHQLIRADAISFLKTTLSDASYDPFDLVVVDPPTYSNSKRTSRDWDVQRDYAEALNLIAPKLTDGGIIYFSTNFRRFRFDASSLPQLKAHEISKQSVPEDFRNRRIHRCWRLERCR